MPNSTEKTRGYLNHTIKTTRRLACSCDKNLDANNTNTYNNSNAGVAELADAADLKSAGEILVGSSPTPGTIADKGKPCPG